MRTRDSRPACFESEQQWREWCALAGLSGLPRCRYCVDCTPEFLDAMAAAGRCEHPETVFVLDKGESVRGLHSGEKGWFRAVTGHFAGNGKLGRSTVVAMASPLAIIEELRRRKTNAGTAV